MWRLATSSDDNEIIEMCLALNLEDPGPNPVPAKNIINSLRELREHPTKGRAVVLEVENKIAGYAFLISFWSNELGGEVCNLDEIYVKPTSRNMGCASSLIKKLMRKNSLWLGKIVALELEINPGNPRAKKLYEALGFQPSKNSPMRFYFSNSLNP